MYLGAMKWAKGSEMYEAFYKNLYLNGLEALQGKAKIPLAVQKRHFEGTSYYNYQSVINNYWEERQDLERESDRPFCDKAYDIWLNKKHNTTILNLWSRLIGLQLYHENHVTLLS